MISKPLIAFKSKAEDARASCANMKKRSIFNNLYAAARGGALRCGLEEACKAPLVNKIDAESSKRWDAPKYKTIDAESSSAGEHSYWTLEGGVKPILVIMNDQRSSFRDA